MTFYNEREEKFGQQQTNKQTNKQTHKRNKRKVTYDALGNVAIDEGQVFLIRMTAAVVQVHGERPVLCWDPGGHLSLHNQRRSLHYYFLYM